MTRQRWIWLTLGLSIAFNCAFLGAFGYRLWRQHRHASYRAEEQGRFGPPDRGDWSAPLREMGPPVEFRGDQRAHLRHMQGEFLPRVGKTHGVLFEKRRALFELVTSEKPDTVAIHRAIEEIGRLQVQVEKEVFRQMLREREVMDPEQRARFREQILRRMRENRAFGFPPGGPPPGPGPGDPKPKPHTQEKQP